MNKKVTVSLIILILLILVSLGGWYFFTKENTEVPAAPTPDSSVSGLSTLFVIPDLGIQFKANSDIQDLTYSVKNLGDFGEAAYFSTKGLSELEPNCSSTYNSIGAVAVLNEKQWQDAQGGFGTTASTTNTFDPANPNTPVHLGSQYIIYDGPGGLCTSDAAIIQIQKKAAAALVQSLGTLEATSTEH